MAQPTLATQQMFREVIEADREHYESGDAHADAAVDRWRQMFAEFDAREAN